ncbi:MAG: SDR family NAD(P)-dependent oxidoreductase, partial [Deltaproteobacteria bacterium]|nr:SDR family NAD(P)-dependent oxidoreductase [Deltaproteobacteria bacterium]
GSVLHLVQALSRAAVAPRLWLVTRGAQAVGDGGEVAVHQSPLWGLGRVIAIEHPELHSVSVDLDPGAGGGDEGRLVAELCRRGDDGEDRIAFRGNKRYGARLLPAGSRETGRDEAPRRFGIRAYGILGDLTYGPMERRRPGRGEVEIEVLATGLNFRDVLRSLGMLKEYEDLAASEARFGFECSGRIAALGAGVEGLRVGDGVIAALTTEGSLGSSVTVEALRVVGKPHWMSPEEAATIPLAFLTASYGLECLARLARGESVLIHAAAGGVGLAAIQIAQRAGARIYATASPGKWEYVKSLGVEAVLNSRTLDYGDEIKALTAGRGVDVILNSLTGEYIPKNLEILSRGGRFVEIGKIGIWDRDQVRRLRPDVCYYPFDLGDVAREDPGLLREMLADLMQGFERRELKPLTRTLFGLEEAEKAFRFMAQARHIGKVVLTRDKERWRARPDATYLITGGLGALGLATAEWLASRGAKTLVLCGRRGVDAGSAEGDLPPGAGVPAAVQEAVSGLERSGTRVEVLRVDVTVPAEVSRMMGILAAMPPLRGVVHSAGVLDDGVVLNQDWERFKKVLAPKTAGAWNLHEATLGLALDFFVSYSSVAAILGSAGQSSYGAANAFLDGLIRKRKHEGLPGLSVNWGPWELGMAAGLTDAGRERMGVQGFGAIGPAEGFAALERLLLQDEKQACVLPINWSRYLRYHTDGTVPPFFAAVTGGGGARRDGDGQGRKSVVLEKLGAAPEGRRRAILREYVGSQVAAVLGERAADGIRPRQRLFDLGIDSLMSVELKNRLQSGTRIPLGATLVFDYPTVEALADHLLERWSSLQGPVHFLREETKTSGAEAGQRPGTEPGDTGRQGAAFPGGPDLDAASPEEIARMLAEELEAGKQQ